MIGRTSLRLGIQKRLPEAESGTKAWRADRCFQISFSALAMSCTPTTMSARSLPFTIEP